jgi:predicted nucleotidyltransferase
METTPTIAVPTTEDPILKSYRASIDDAFGADVERVVLFGSRARGEADEDSDYDVAVFLKSLPDRWEALDRLARLRVQYLGDTGAFFDAKPYVASAYAERTPLMREIRREGLDL